MPSQAQKAETFRLLHEKSGAFVVPNPWDIGSARMLEAMGFESLATTSSGFAQSLGRVDGEISLEEKIQHCTTLCANTNVPVTADLENCFGDRPEAVAECIERIAESGIVGGSVEDFSGNLKHPIYDLSLAIERVAAAVEAAKRLPFKFMVTARAENLLRTEPDLEDTVNRLQRYAAAGADVLYAPALRTLDEVRMVATTVAKPINVLGTFFGAHKVADLAEAGAKRISTGGGLAHLTSSTLIRAGTALRESGSFAWTRDIESTENIEQYFSSRT